MFRNQWSSQVVRIFGMLCLSLFVGVGIQGCKKKGNKKAAPAKRKAAKKRSVPNTIGPRRAAPARRAAARRAPVERRATSWFKKPLPESEAAAEQEAIQLQERIQGLQQGIQKKKGLLESVKERKKACFAICQATGGICKANQRICQIAKRFPHKKMLQKACSASGRDCKGATRICSTCKAKSR